jgi:molybdate transport system substrate-binding protein
VTRARFAVACAIAAALALGGCGGGGQSGDKRPELVVSAAASLKHAFEDYGARFTPGHARFSFAGSDELAAQIRQGARADVFAAANTKLPDALHATGLVGTPVVFATNRLVLAVPKDSGIHSLADVARSGVKLVVGAPGVPVGSYTRLVLARLPASERRAILANVRSNEPDVAGVVAKVSQHAADAGFVYVTDVVASKGALRAIRLADRLKPQAAYGAATVRAGRHPAQARAFVRGLVRGAGRDALRRAGFGAP